MVTTTSSISRPLRAAVSHRTATTLQNLYPHHPISTLTSPKSFPHSNLRTISNLHFFSTSRRVRIRATKPNPNDIRAALRNLGCLATGGLLVMVYYKWIHIPALGYLGWISEMKLRSTGSLPDFFRKDHSFVVEGLVKSIVTVNAKGLEIYFSGSEVLAYKPDEICAAMERNKEVIAEQERKAMLTWYPTLSDEISKSAPDLSKSKSRPGGVVEGRVKQSTLSPEDESFITGILNAALVDTPGLRDELQEGHSFVIKGFFKMITDETKEEKSDKSVTVKARDWECHLSFEVLAKRDEKSLPQEVVIAAATMLPRNKKIIREEQKVWCS